MTNYAGHDGHTLWIEGQRYGEPAHVCTMTKMGAVWFFECDGRVVADSRNERHQIMEVNGDGVYGPMVGVEE